MGRGFNRIQRWLEGIGRRRVHFLTFFIVAAGMLLSLRFSGYFYRLFLLNSYAGEALDRNTIYFSLHSDAGSIDLSELQDKEIICNATLLAHAPSTGAEYCILYTSGKDDIFGGEYFSGWDFTSGEAGCIVGAGAATQYDGRTAYLKSGRYKILATRKESFIAGINSAVFFTDSLLDRVSTSEILAVASSRKSEVSASYERFKEYMKGKGVILNPIVFRTITLEDFLDYNSGFLLALGGFALLLFVIHLLLYWYWRQYKKPWCRVMYLFGVQNVKLRAACGFAVLLAISDFFGGIVYCAVTEGMYFGWEILIGGAATIGVQMMAVLSGIFLELFER